MAPRARKPVQTQAASSVAVYAAPKSEWGHDPSLPMDRD